MNKNNDAGLYYFAVFQRKVLYSCLQGKIMSFINESGY